MYCLYATDISFMEVCMCHVGLEKADLVGLFQREFTNLFLSSCQS